MLDLTGIVFSSAMMVFIIVRAVQLDRITPWFQKLTAKIGAKTDGAQPWRPRS
jgi:hypothetical protein